MNIWNLEQLKTLLCEMVDELGRHSETLMWFNSDRPAPIFDCDETRIYGLQSGPLLVVPHWGSCTFNDRHVPLAPMPFRLLCVLMANHGIVCSSQRLALRVFGGEGLLDRDRTCIKNYIMKIRKAVGDEGPRFHWIQSVRPSGYAFIGPKPQKVYVES